MSTFFSNARDLSINGGSFSIIHGNQNNYSCPRISRVSGEASSIPSFPSGLGKITQATSSRTMTTTVQIHGNQINQIIQQEKEHTEFDDFQNLKRGDICKLQNICQAPGRCDCDAWYHEGKCLCLLEVTRTFCTVKLIGVEGKFTAVTYSGQDARKVFEEEFLELSRIQFSEASQIYAIANGAIPSMVLWHNLIPLIQFKGNVRGLSLLYLESLRRQLGCDDDELWLDSTRGVICHGPKGPYSSFPEDWLAFKDLPPSAELLQEAVLVRFLASQEADEVFMTAMNEAGFLENVLGQVNQPTILSDLTKTPIAFTNNIWESRWDYLTERTCLENGLTRFRLNGDGWLMLWLNWNTENAWLSQASSIFYAQEILLNNDLIDLSLIYRKGLLGVKLDQSPSKCQLRQRLPIFLFIHLPTANLCHGFTSSLHHWSFQEDGYLQIPPKLCWDLGLPVKLHYYDEGCCSYSLPTDSYKSLHQYQVARGFNPATANFAQHLGYGNYEFQPFNGSYHSKEVYEGQISPCLKNPTELSGFDNTTNSGNLSKNTQDQTWAECSKVLDAKALGTEAMVAEVI
ncbi:hypothetical protein PQX77_010918 [Marasmius sp. AFHP31]|nr:hypothetical protein PQX77_010918 [Marasmius sp. AFHP31]